MEENKLTDDYRHYLVVFLIDNSGKLVFEYLEATNNAEVSIQLEKGRELHPSTLFVGRQQGTDIQHITNPRH